MQTVSIQLSTYDNLKNSLSAIEMVLFHSHYGSKFQQYLDAHYSSFDNEQIYNLISMAQKKQKFINLTSRGGIPTVLDFETREDYITDMKLQQIIRQIQCFFENEDFNPINQFQQTIQDVIKLYHFPEPRTFHSIVSGFRILEIIERRIQNYITKFGFDQDLYKIFYSD